MIWAIDPFESKHLGDGLVSSAVDVVRCFQAKRNTLVQPVHVLGPSELILTAAEAPGPNTGLGHYESGARRALDSFIQQTGLCNIARPVILHQTTPSIARSTDAIIRFASEANADLILVSSHGRTGIDRLLLGSFAETLLFRSHVPVMVVGPKMHKRFELNRLLFPTDFGDRSDLIFRKAVYAARDFGVKMTIFHVIPKPVEPLFIWIPVQEFLDQALFRAQRHGEAWARWATHQGVACEAVVEIGQTSLAETILNTSKTRKMDWICMGAQNTGWSARLLGSVTRHVLRGAHCPVWVLRPDLSKHELEKRKVA